jgi:CheY-like chemotaxis protein
LSIVKSLVELHSGSVQAESEGRDRGSTLVVKLPIAPATIDSTGTHESLADASRASGIETPVLPGIRVLLVDDDSDARSLISRVLEDQGARVRAAADAREALGMLETEPFDVLISDIGMPDADGYELIRRVRQLPQGRGGMLPAIALTAFAQPSDRALAIGAGFQRHVTKPVEARELVTSIAELISQ